MLHIHFKGFKNALVLNECDTIHGMFFTIDLLKHKHLLLLFAPRTSAEPTFHSV